MLRTSSNPPQVRSAAEYHDQQGLSFPHGTVTLKVTIRGWKMYPRLVGKPRANRVDGGRWVIVVDGRCNNLSTSTMSGKTNALRKGTHRIHAELASNDGVHLLPRVKSKSVNVKINVPAGARSAPASRFCSPKS
jgi:hypothetical protein